MNRVLASGVWALVFLIGLAWVFPMSAQVQVGNAPRNATYITQTANGTLTAEQALSSFAVGSILKVIAGGVLDDAEAPDLIALFGSCSGGLKVLQNDGNCGTVSTDVSVITGMGTNVPAWLITPSSANLAAALTNETGSALAVFSDSPVLTTRFDLDAAGVRFVAADGALTLLGLGNGNDEDLKIDLDNAAANAVALSSTTGVTDVTWTGNVVLTGSARSAGSAINCSSAPSGVTVIEICNATPAVRVQLGVSGANIGSMFGSGGGVWWGPNSNPGSYDLAIIRAAVGIARLSNASTGGAGLQFTERTAPSAPAGDNGIIYAVDNGGKTQLCAQFATGVPQCFATEP